MKLEELRPGVFRGTFSAHELSVLLAGARMSLSLMEEDSTGTTAEAREALESVLADVDDALARLKQS